MALDAELPKLWIARQQKPLEDFAMPRVFKWFLLWIYDRYGFAATGYQVEVGRTDVIIDYCSYEDRGFFTNEADARWAANCKGGSYKALPLDAALPEETCKFGTHDFPQSPSSSYYRNRKLPYCTVPSRHIEWLQNLLKQTERG